MDVTRRGFTVRKRYVLVVGKLEWKSISIAVFLLLKESEEIRWRWNRWRRR